MTGQLNIHGFQVTDGISLIFLQVTDPAYGMYIWPSAPVLAQYVWIQKNFVSNKNVLEVTRFGHLSFNLF